MPAPEQVNTGKFTVVDVLFNQDDFSVAHGIWNDNDDHVIGMRWNDGEDGNGYPKAFGNPQWFIVSSDIARNVLSGLLTHPSLSVQENQAILKALKHF